uniref:GPI ethanolamine phosphate transferase 3, catalytic subunit n=1 Tax=Laticauda laticaudata TaxID=8630 RepID=A0A8C5RVV7_LATLA
MGRRAAAAAGLAWAALLPCAALALFAAGFLLMRLELGQRSACHLPPGRAPTSPGGAPSSSSCWLPAAARFPRAALVLIDALRFDFAAWPRPDRRPGARPPRPFEGRLGSLRRLALRQPRHGRLYRFRADPPSTTMQRLKALTTGSLPTFVDAGSNFASYAVREDNLLWQLASNGRKVVFMGDDTWEGLFPQAFHRAHFFPSFNVKDLHTVDDGILQHLYQTVDGGEWDLLIAHFLGVDHCGHKHGPDHPEMAKKLSQMDEMLSSLVDHLGNDTLLLVAGDHGMTTTGDHGGDSDEELDAALFVYSKAPLFQEPPPEEPQTVPQVNLVPTLALLLGVPVPYSNIGEVMADLFATEGDVAASLSAQLAAYDINARQVDRFLHAYAEAAQDLPAEKLRHLRGLFRSAVEEHEHLLAQEASLALLLPRMEGLRRRFQQYLREARAVCAESWARFHPGCMVAGCALLTSSCLLCYVASRLALHLDFYHHHVFIYPLLWGLVGAALLGLAHLLWGVPADLLLLCAWGAAASQLGFFWHCWARRPPALQAAGLCPPFEGLRLRPRLWAGPGLSLGVLFLRCAAMLSDSFVVAEGQVVPFLLTSLVLLEALKLQWKGRLDGSLLCWQLLAALGGVVLCARLSGLFWKCREETPACQTASILGPLSSVQEPRAKNLYYGLCLGALASLVWGTRCWLRHYGNLNSPCALVLFVRWGFPLLALALAGFWAITSGTEEALVKRHAWARLALEAFPRGIYALVVAGLLLVWWDPVTVFLEGSQEVPLVSSSSEALIPQLYRRMQASLKSRLEEAPGSCRATVAAYGLGSVYSAALLIALALLAFLLMTLHTERLSLAFLLLFVEAFALLWMQACARALSSSSTHSDPFEVPWETLVAWALAAAQFFYATGHQPVFPAIHWNAAFVGFQQGHTTNLLPALLVGANTFASQILLAAGCPLLLLWPFVCEPSTSGTRRPNARLQDRAEEPMMEMRLREAPERFSAALLQLGLRYLLILGLQLLASVLAAMILRRHLMVWKVFAPKFIFEAVGFVVSCVSLLLGLGLVMRVDCAVSKWFKQVILAQPR